MQPEAAQNREYEQSQFDLLCRGEEMTEVTGAYESPILEPGPAGMSPAVEIQWGAFLRSGETRVCDAGHPGVVTNNVPLERPFEKRAAPSGGEAYHGSRPAADFFEQLLGCSRNVCSGGGLPI